MSTSHLRVRSRITLASLLAAGFLAVACSRGAGPAMVLHGTQVTPVQGKPTFTLTATDGRPFDFAADTRGDATLLFFGYTYCPDVCPMHLSNLAAALKRLPNAVQERVKVVFVSTDPARDTPDRLRAWLDTFDHRFIGLRGPIDQVNRIGGALRLPPAIVDSSGGPAAPGGRPYGVNHAAVVFAFAADDSLRAVYMNGTPLGDWVDDLPKLVAMRPRGR
jgi:protein SCO1/2